MAYAETLLVPDDYETIQTAIDAAVDGDEIIVAPGTYVENLTFLGKQVTLASSDGAVNTCIDGGTSSLGLEYPSVVTFDSDEGLFRFEQNT